ncbi:MAG: hypothetical protein ACXQTI_03545 [Candidatus Nezhaarchaeales archaeon]
MSSKTLMIAGIVILVLGIMITVVIWPFPKMITYTWLEETFTLGPLIYRSYKGSFPQGTELTIHLEVIGTSPPGRGPDINFFVVDQENYLRLSRYQSFSYYTIPSRLSIAKATLVWKPPPNEQIYFVYSNTHSLITSKTVYTKIIVKVPRGF